MKNMERSEKLQQLLQQLKTFDTLLSQTDGDEISEDLTLKINSTLEELNYEIVSAQSDEIQSLKVKFINKSKNIDPAFAYEGDSGFDLRADLDSSVTIKPFERFLVPTGLFFELQKGTEIQVRPRSGLAIKHGITVLNSPGTVDSHYRGEVKVPLINLGNEPFTIEPGDRIAQAVVMPVFGEGKIKLIQTESLNETVRGEGGFNSSGVK
jgi:dUTP pyrophosphatase